MTPCLVAPTAGEEPTAGRERDKIAIRAAAQAYQDALSRGDGTALAGFWTADGDVVDEQGNTFAGRKSAAAVTKPAAGAGRPDLRIRETSLRFLSDDVALEDGMVEVGLPGGAQPVRGRFSATWVRQAGAWKLAALREDRLDAPAGAETLQDLDWMVGEWTVNEDRVGRPTAAAGNRAAMEVTVRWNANRTFLLRDLKIPVEAADESGQPSVLSVTQRIGWDPLSRRIRSWVFSSDGGHGEAIWSRDGDSWVARTAAVLPDGTQTSSLNIYSFDGKDRCVWRSLPTHVGGEHAPAFTMVMTRKPKGKTP
ncbi:MAG: YybH family protein [Planctomycetia bacterium]|jgi:uncharacterized protein (TIGR02246 family)